MLILLLLREDPQGHTVLCCLERFGCFALPKPISIVAGSGNDSGIIPKGLFKVREGWRSVGKGRALPQQLRGWGWAGAAAGQGETLLGAQLRLLPLCLNNVGFGAGPNPRYPNS